MSHKPITDFYQVDAKYIDQLHFLQVELLKLQKYVAEHKLRLAIFFEGRDAAGKGSAIARFTQFLNPSTYRTIALGKPTKTERGQWYFQRYLRRLPNAGQMVFFDRSWYNRAVVEPVMGFCTPGSIPIVCAASKTTGKYADRRWADAGQVLVLHQDRGSKGPDPTAPGHSPHSLESEPGRSRRPGKMGRLLPLYKNRMFEKTSTEDSPWMIVQGKSREDSRIQAVQYILSLVDYDDRSPDLTPPDKSTSCLPGQRALPEVKVSRISIPILLLWYTYYFSLGSYY